MNEDKDSPINGQFSQALRKFLIEINGLYVALPIIKKSLGEENKNRTENLVKFLNEKGESIEEEDLTDDNGDHTVKTRHILSAEHFYGLRRLFTESAHVVAASKIIPQSFLVALISQYDALIGALIKAIFFSKPELLNASQKQFSFLDLIAIGSIEEARDYLAEKEVESVLRESHIKHFDWLESKLKITLRKDLSVWPNFVELTERRNLFVHTDGVISSQYLEVCRANNSLLSEGTQVGDKVGVNSSYYKEAYETLYEIGTKLCQVLWRKLVPEDIDFANMDLNSICYDLLQEEKYQLAQRLLSFALSIPQRGSNRYTLMFTVNYAIALKWGGKPAEAAKVLEKTDWSACGREFKLAVATLQDDFQKAAEIMIRIGNNGEVKKEDYKDWPVFKDFRHSNEFLEAYDTIFGDILEKISSEDQDEIEDLIENEKNQLIQELMDSGSFYSTHSIISRLDQHVRFSKSQVDLIAEAAINNTQVSWIIGDHDVEEFIKRILRDYTDVIDSDYFDSLTEMLA